MKRNSAKMFHVKHFRRDGRLQTKSSAPIRRGGRVVECGGLENRFARNPGNEGSNPSSSASIKHEVGKRISDLFSLLVPLMVPQTVPLSAPHLEKFKLFVDGTFSGTRNGTFQRRLPNRATKPFDRASTHVPSMFHMKHRGHITCSLQLRAAL